MAENDKILWQGLREGKEKALLGLYQNYYADLMRIGRMLSYHSDISKDTVNQVFLELWERHERLPEVENLRSYLITYFKRKLMAEIMQGRKHDSWQDWHNDTETSATIIDEMIEEEFSAEMKEKLSAAMAKLPKRQREFLKLRYYEGMNYEQIAEHTGLTVRTIYNKIHEATKTLREKVTWLLALIFCYS